MAPLVPTPMRSAWRLQVNYNITLYALEAYSIMLFLCSLADMSSFFKAMGSLHKKWIPSILWQTLDLATCM